MNDAFHMLILTTKPKRSRRAWIKDALTIVCFFMLAACGSDFIHSEFWLYLYGVCVGVIGAFIMNLLDM